MKFLLILTLILQTYLFSRTVSNSSSSSTSSTTVTVTPPPSPPSPPSGGGGGGGGSGSGSGSGSGGGGVVHSTPIPNIYLTVNEYTIFSEEDKKDGLSMKFNVAFSAPLPNDIVLEYEIDTEDSGSGDTITLGSDITNSSSNSISIDSGTTSVDIIVDVVDDSEIEDAEYFFIKLSTPSSGLANFSMINDRTLGVILDNDTKVSKHSTDGNYYVYEHNTNDINITTKIVENSINLDIYAKSGVEVLHDIHTDVNRTCSTPSCTTTTNPSGATVTSCTTNCIVTRTEIWEYSESMNIKKVLLHRFRDYDKATSSCINQDSSLTLIQDVNLSSGEKLTVTIPPSNEAFRCVNLEVIGLSEPLYTTGLPIMYSGASDSFAIRPKKFSITAPAVVTSANNFNLNIKALTQLGNSSKNYNYANSMIFNLKASDKIYGEDNITTLGFDLSAFTLTNGDGNQNIKYIEVGEVDINISENPDNYFAIVDGSHSYIEPDLKTVIFDAAKFDVDYSANEYKNGDFAFFSNNPVNMYSSVDIDIKALNSDDDITKRYTKTGYAKNTEITFKQAINTRGSGIRTIKSDGVAIDTDLNSDGTFVDTTRVYTKDDFLDGVLFTNRFKQSFLRVKNKAINPIELNTAKVEIKESIKPAINGSKINIGNITKSYHYYGRAHVAPDPVIVKGKNLDANVFYEIYCEDCDKSKFTYAGNRASIESIRWYILPSSSYNNATCDIDNTVSVIYTTDVSSISKFDSHTIKMSVSKSPHSNRVIYKPSYDYLLYDRINPNITTHKFRVKFTDASSKWAGEGILGNTVDIDVSKIGNQAVDW